MRPKSIEHLNDLWRDACYGARMFARSPGFTLASTVCLGIGIGLATSIFSQFQASVFKPTPGVKAPGSLVSFQGPVSFPDFEEYRDQSGQFEAAAAFLAPVPFVISDREQPERVWGHIVTSDYFRVLGVNPAIGRLFGPEDAMPGSSAVIFSHRFWKARFGGRKDLIGKTVRINGQAVTVIGVAEPDFIGATPFLAVADLWIATTAHPRIAPELADDPLRSRSLEFFQVVGRLKSGATVGGAEEALDSMARRLENQHGDPDRLRVGRRVTLLPGGKAFPIRERDLPVVVAFPVVIVGLILLIACANVATLLVARAAARQKEIAIRLSIGASRPRLVRQLLTESALLALLGGAAGLAFVFWHHSFVERFTSILPSQMRYEWRIDWRAYITAYGVAGLCAIAFGLAPALQATRSDVAGALKSGFWLRLRAHRWFSLRNFLVVQQLMASLTLLLLTAFIVVGFHRSKSIELGFEPGNLFLMSVDPVRDGYPVEQAEAFCSELPERVRRIAGVKDAALAQSPPFGLNAGESIMAAKMELSGGPELVQRLRSERVGAAFFRTLGVPVLAGRTFREEDQREDARVAVVNQTMARETWPGLNAVGQTVELDEETYAVIGVVGDVRSGFALERPRQCVYLPVTPSAYATPSPRGVTLLVRAERGVPVPLLVRHEVRTVLPDLTLFNISSMTEQIEQSASLFRIGTAIYGGIGLFGLLLSAVGLGGVTAYAAARRTHEIGIRRALGARDFDVLKLVLKEGAALIAVGTALGMALAFAAVRALSTTLSAMAEITQTSIHDPLLLVGAPLLLATLSLLACWLPARRSLRIQPVDALRME